MLSSTTPTTTETLIINIMNNHLSEKNLKFISFIKVEVMAKLLYGIALECTGVSNKVAFECRTDCPSV